MARVVDAGVGGSVGTEAKRQAGNQVAAASTRPASTSAAAAAKAAAAATGRDAGCRRDGLRAQREAALLQRLEHACAGFEAMAVLVQYLAHELNAFDIPTLKQQLIKEKDEWLKAKLDFDELCATQVRERKRAEQRLNERDQTHREEIRQIKSNYDSQVEKLEKELAKEHSSRLEAEQLNNNIEARLFETKTNLHETERRLNELKTRFSETEAKYINTSAKLSEAEAKINEIEARMSTPPPPPAPPALTQSKWLELHNEISSLKSVLELKQKEVHSLRQTNVRLSLEAERVPGLEQRLAGLQARVEDLGLQLERKTSLERQLSRENRSLAESVQQTSQQRDRLTQDKEALQWRLKQNLDMYAILAELSGAETATAAAAAAAQLNANSDRSDMYSGMSSSATHMKGIVHKGDSVSWVLDMDESAETVLNRLVRRAGSFRSGSTSPPSAFTSPVHSKSLPPGKRQRPRLRSHHLRVKSSDEWSPQAEEKPDVTTTPDVASSMEASTAPASDGSSGSSPTPQEATQLLEARVAMRATLQEAGGEAMISEETSDEEHHGYSDEDHYNLSSDQKSLYVKDSSLTTSPSSLDKLDDF